MGQNIAQMDSAKSHKIVTEIIVNSSKKSVNVIAILNDCST